MMYERVLCRRCSRPLIRPFPVQAIPPRPKPVVIEEGPTGPGERVEARAKELEANLGFVQEPRNVEGRIWEVWIEGFSVNGKRFPAMFLGLYKGKTFRDAVENWIESLPGIGRAHYNSEPLEYGGCKLFDNEEDARKNFG